MVSAQHMRNMASRDKRQRVLNLDVGEVPMGQRREIMIEKTCDDKCRDRREAAPGLSKAKSCYKMVGARGRGWWLDPQRV